MRIRINADKFLLVIVIIACLFNGVVAQMTFWAATSMLLIRSSRTLDDLQYKRRYLLILGLYIALFIVQIAFNKVEDFNALRLFGLTRALIGISLLRLSSTRVGKMDIMPILFGMASLINFLYYINAMFHVESAITSFATINLASCISLIMAPYLFYDTMENKHKLIKTIFIISHISIGTIYPSSTYIVGNILLVLFGTIITLSKHIRDIELFKRIRNILLLVIVITVAVFLFYVPLRLRYISLLYDFDADRANILEGSFQYISRFTNFEKIFGRGNNIFLHRVRLLEAHNAIVECFMIYGSCGVMIFLYETITFLKDVIISKPDNRFHAWIVIGSIALSYICYMIHPFYSSSFLTKIFLVLPAVFVSNNEDIQKSE